MSASAVAVLSDLAEGMVDAVLEEGEEGGMRALRAALERYRSAGALSVLAPWRGQRRPTQRDRLAVDVLKRLDRDLLAHLTGRG